MREQEATIIANQHLIMNALASLLYRAPGENHRRLASDLRWHVAEQRKTHPARQLHVARDPFDTREGLDYCLQKYGNTGETRKWFYQHWTGSGW